MTDLDAEIRAYEEARHELSGPDCDFHKARRTLLAQLQELLTMLRRELDDLKREMGIDQTKEALCRQIYAAKSTLRAMQRDLAAADTPAKARRTVQRLSGATLRKMLANPKREMVRYQPGTVHKYSSMSGLAATVTEKGGRAG